jgi:hypothetical protein
MRKAIIAGFAVLAIAALAVASDVWKNKPYQQWDQKDVQKVMSDSPWAKMVQVDATWQKGGDTATSSGLPQGSSAGAGAGGGGRGGMGGGGGSAPSGGPGMGGSTPNAGNSTPQVAFVVRWASSRAIREAIVRGEEISGKMKDDEGQKQLDIPVDTYQVLLSGQSMTPFESAEEATLKTSTYLTTKKAKQKIEPSKVEFERSPDGKTLYSILISFPTKTATGEATIGADEKGVEFVCSVPGVNIKTSFDFSKMYDSGGRDL